MKYGVTGDYVLGLQIVTGKGELVRIGRRTAKGVAGYDLTHLIVGSEGTLGVVTEITVRLRPARPYERTIVGYFSSAADAGNAAAGVVAAGVVPSALELVDRHCLKAVDDWKSMGLSLEANVLLLARTDAPGSAGEQEAAKILAAFEGKLHPLLITPAGDDAARVRAQHAFDDIIADALDLGGTVTGEHGVGILKLKGLARELPGPVMEMHRAIKAALDPHGILHPGKVVPAQASR